VAVFATQLKLISPNLRVHGLEEPWLGDYSTFQVSFHPSTKATNVFFTLTLCFVFTLRKVPHFPHSVLGRDKWQGSLGKAVEYLPPVGEFHSRMTPPPHWPDLDIGASYVLVRVLHLPDVYHFGYLFNLICLVPQCSGPAHAMCAKTKLQHDWLNFSCKMAIIISCGNYHWNSLLK
jgi:hypothetical protein